MIFLCDNVWAHVRNAASEEIRFLDEYLRLKNPRAGFMPGAASSLTIYDHVNKRFPVGLATLVAREAASTGLEVELRDKRPLPPVDPDYPSIYDFDWPWEYQLDAAAAALMHRRGIIKIPGGGGKSEVIVLVVWAVPAPALFITKTTELALDLHERWQKYTDTRAGLVVGGSRPRVDVQDSDRLTCSTFSKLVAMYKDTDPRLERLFVRTRALHIDECHIAAAGWNDILAREFVNADWRFGYSATPLDRLDRRNTLIVGTIGPIIFEKKTAELVAEKKVSQCHVTMIGCAQVSEKKTLAGVRRELMVRSEKRNGLLLEIVRRAKKPALLFVKLLEHGHLLEKVLINAGIAARFIHGVHSTEYRKAAARDLVAGRLDVVIANKIWHDGINIQSLRSVIDGGGGKSITETLQRAMRGQRIVAHEKYDFDLWDIYDKCQTWLERHAKARKRAYKREGFKITIVNSLKGLQT